MPQPDSAKDVHAVGQGGESRKWRGQDIGRVERIGLGRAKADRRSATRLCGADIAYWENPTRKPDKKEKNPTRKPDKKEVRRQQILEFCTEPRTSSDILDMLGLKDKENLMEVYINPMIAGNLLSMTEPDNPTSRNQMYVTIKAARF